jgi:ribonuclease Z
MIVVPLGIASATPTITRHLPSVALWREGSIFLFDAGENAQMRLLQAGLKRSKIDTIFISHLDIDHISGLVGLLATFQLQRACCGGG